MHKVDYLSIHLSFLLSIPDTLLTVPESRALLSSSLSTSSLPRTESQLDLTGSTEHIDALTDDGTPSSKTRTSEDLRRTTLKKQVPVIG